jgi:hypothetical protein
MLRRIVAMRPQMVILSSYDHYVARDGEPSETRGTAAAGRNGLRRTYGLLSSAGINTVVIRGTPSPGFDVPACLSRRASGAPLSRNCEYDRERSSSRSRSPRRMTRLADSSTSPRDVNDRFCSGQRCPVVQRGAIVFRDDGHLTATFSLATAPVLRARIARAMDALTGRR